MAVDDAAFREFFASEYPRLCWLGFLLTGSRAEGEELAQEALVRIWWRWQPGRRPADPRARPAEAPPAGTERAMVLWEAVQALPPRQRAVLLRPRPGGHRHGGATMNLDGELRELFGQPDETSWPGEATAYDRFLRRRRRRGRAVAAATGLALVAILAGAVLVPRLLPSEVPTVAPSPDLVRVGSQGFELKLPAGWRVERELRGTRALARGEALPGTSIGVPRAVVVGLVLVPRSGKPPGARITITTDSNQRLDHSLVQGGSRRADGRAYRFHPGSISGEVGRYAMLWPDWCAPRMGCGRSAWPRILLVTGTADADGDQVRQVMKRIVGALKPITNAVRPPPPPTVPARTKVLLGKGGEGMTAWEAWIEPLQGNGGFSVHFPWEERRHPGRGWHWESMEPSYIQRDGTYTLMDCFSWVPGSGLLLTGLAREEVASVRFELAGQPPVTVATFGKDHRIPWVAYASPKLPAGSRVERVLAFDAAGKLVGGEEEVFGGEPLCRPR